MVKFRSILSQKMAARIGIHVNEYSLNYWDTFILPEVHCSVDYITKNPSVWPGLCDRKNTTLLDELSNVAG